MAQARKFGWFAGVFTPSILTILGVIMYLRLPSIVGQAGLWTAIGIIVVAHVISVCTGLSVASIATDKRVEAGGTYYMISRSLGLPIGGTLGLALFVGLSFSVSLYVIGFSESFLGYIGMDVTKDTIRIAGTVTLIAVTVVTFLSTELALRAQFYIMLAIGLSLLSIVTGSHDLAPGPAVTTSLAQGAPFIVLFGIFFPAVTGFEAGVSMSGDLKDPKKAIPVGTILAILVGLTVYLLLATFFARTVSLDALRDDPNILLNISRFPALVVAGIWGATISSALGSILGAPRILQATATDGIAPRFFGRGFGPSNEPRNALLVTFVIAEVGILIGELDVIARVVSMFFITTYGFLNLSCAIERWASPDFRPEFRVPAAVSLIGAAACFIVMVQLDLIAMLGATVVLGTVYLLLQRRQLTLASGDTWEGFWSSVSRVALSRLSQRQGHQRNWRPNILLFAGETEGRQYLRRLGEWLAYQRGMLSNVELVPRTASGRIRSQTLEGVEERTGFFASQVDCEDVYDGMVSVARLHGFAGIRPNTVLLGWPGADPQPTAYHSALASMAELDLNLLVLAYDERVGYGDARTMDVWLEGGGRNAALALALVGFLVTADKWRRAEVRFLKWYQGESAFAGAVHDAIHRLVQDRRLSAQVQVVQAVPGEDFATAVHRESGATDLTLIGIPEAGSLASKAFVAETNQIVEAIGTVLLLRGSKSFEDLELGEFASEAHLAAQAEGWSEAPVDWASLAGDPALGSELENLHVTLRGIAETLASELSVAEGLAADLLTDTSETVENTFASLHESLEEKERTRPVRAVDRATARLLYRSTEILTEAGGPRLESQARALTTAVGLAVRRLENLPASLPVRFETRAGKRDVRLRASFEAQVLPGLLARIEDSVRRFDRLEGARLDGAARLQAGAVDALDRLAAALEEPGSNVLPSLEEERARLTALGEELSEEWVRTSESDRDATRSMATTLLSDWAGSLSRSGGGAAARRARAGTDAAIGRLRDVGAVWSVHQSARVAEAVLQSRLRSTRHRLRVVLERAFLDARVDVESTLRGLDGAAEALGERMEGSVEATARIADVPGAFDGEAFLKNLAGELRTGLVELPQDWTGPPRGSRDAADPLEPTEPVEITPRSTVDQLLQAKLLTPLEPTLLALGTAARRARETAADVRRLVRFSETDEDDPERDRGTRPLQAVLASGLERVQHARQSVADALDAAVATANEGLKTVESHMIASALSSGDPVEASRAGDGGSRFLSRLSDWIQEARIGLNRRMAGVWYRRSRGVILSGRLRAGERAEGTPLGRLADLVESLSPDPQLLDRLPFFYRQLFLGHARATRDFWVARPRMQSGIRSALERFSLGYGGGLLVIGEPRSGRTSALARIGAHHGGGGPSIPVAPPPFATSDPDLFDRHLAQGLEASGAAEDALSLLPSGSAVIVDDLDLWWERRPGGLAVVERILDLIDRFGSRLLFTVAVTPASVRLLRRLIPLEERFVASVHLDPFSAEQLRDIVLVRHRSTGFDLDVDGRPTGALAEWRVARFFNRLFQQTRGNVGDSLQAWISSVESVDANTIGVGTLESPRLAALEELSAPQRTCLAALVLHRRLRSADLSRIVALSESDMDREVAVLKRCAMVESDGDVLAVNAFVEPSLRRDLEERGVL